MVRIYKAYVMLGVMTVAVLGVAVVASAQQLPIMQGATVQADATLASNGIFTYSYTATNLTSNTGAIWTLDLDIAKPSGGTQLSDQGLANGPGYLANSSALVLQQPITAPMIPVGLQAPPHWVVGLSVQGTAGWAAITNASLIQPGQSTSGFQITSFGLPTIRTMTLLPFIDLEKVSLTEPTGPDDLARYTQQLASLTKSVTVQLKTVGPTAPPATLDPIAFLKVIQGYKEAALKQGWITNPGVANSLDVKLNAALAALQRNDSNTAKNILNALLNEVDAQAGKHLTSEAVALLKFNVQFLLSHL